MVRITEKIRAVVIEKADGLSTNVYILNCENGLILIDVGFTELCIKNIEAELNLMEEKWENIRLILITHAHGDHILNLPKILELASYPEVMIGEGDIDALKEETGIEADIGLEQGDIIDACGGIEVIHVPGHSEGNLSFYLRSEKAMIVGDSIFGDDEGTLFTPPAKYSKNFDMAAKEIRRLLNYDFNILLLSHGKNILNNAKMLVEKLLSTSNQWLL
jgi:glyoxylase-like metal-dependent hydrolase (beta-lactamase superfamily II)